MRSCASCHGRKLQGQPLWQLDDQHSHRRAPAHDETGHTWQHSDEEIFQMIKFGRFSTTPPGAVSYMPAFEDVLSDPEILEVMAFIKARWPLGLRVSQEMLNPGFTGMPARANEIEWTLPPNCTATLQRWRELHRDVAALAGRVPISCVRETRGTTLADAILLDASVEWWLTGIKTPTAAPAA